MSVGQLVTLITVDDKSFSGVLNTFDDKAGKVVLKNVVTDGCKLPDLQTFFVSDIKDLAFLEGHGTRESSSDCLLDYVKRVPGRFLSKKNVPSHLLRAPIFNGDKMLLSHIAGDEDGIDQGIGSGEDGDNFEDFYETDDYLLLCRPCEKFREVICYLMEQDIVAAMFYGVEIGRKGTLSVLEVATEEYIFLFDMLRLGMEGLIDGLQEFLESRDVVKIIHDSRMVSDMLYHQYNLTLSNVFDTQVAGAFVFRNIHGGDWPRSVESLPSALLLHMHLTEEDVHIAYVRERSRKMDEEVWLHRPLSKQLLTSTLKNLKRLIPLYQLMCQKLMLPFKVGVDIYLDHVRSAPEGTAAKQRINSHLLPFAFQDLEKITASACKESVYQRQRDPTYDHKGFCENTIRYGLHHSKVIKSRDSIWHSCHKGFPSSRPKNLQSQMTKGLPPEARRPSNKKRVESEPHAINERFASNERSAESISTSSSSDKRKALTDTSLSNLSNVKLQDSPVIDERLRDSSGSFGDPSLWPQAVPKSSTPNNSSQSSALPSASTDISRSALFKLDESPLPAFDLSGSEERSQLKYSSRVAENAQTVPVSSAEVPNARRGDNIPHHDRKSGRVLSPSSCKGSFNSSSDTEGNNFYINRHERNSSESLLPQSRDESNFNSSDERKIPNPHDRLFDEMNMIPAGMQVRKIGKKRAKRIQEQIQLDAQRAKSVSPGKNKLPQNDLEEELSSIPRPSSSHRLNSQTQASFNNSDYSVGDPCDVGAFVDSMPSSKSVLSSFNLPQCQPVTVPMSSTEDEDAGEEVDESYIDEILKLEEVQKILRQTKLDKPSADIKRKLLSSKIRL